LRDFGCPQCGGHGQAGTIVAKTQRPAPNVVQNKRAVIARALPSASLSPLHEQAAFSSNRPLLVRYNIDAPKPPTSAPGDFHAFGQFFVHTAILRAYSDDWLRLASTRKRPRPA